jgi:hypothetical protein
MTKLGGGLANQMRALGYQVLAPEPISDSTCWRMIAPDDRHAEYLAKDEAEGWERANNHWHTRNLEKVFRADPNQLSDPERQGNDG